MKTENMYGHVCAKNKKDPNSEDCIRMGLVDGDGLLGDILHAGFALAKAAENYGYNGDDDAENEESYSDQLDQSRLEFYKSIKLLETELGRYRLRHVEEYIDRQIKEYLSLIQQGLGELQKAVRIRAKLEKLLGEYHPELIGANDLIKLYRR